MMDPSFPLHGYSLQRPSINDGTLLAFVTACRDGDIETIERLVHANTFSNGSIGFALNRALEAGQANAADFLLQIGATFNAQSAFCAAKSKNDSILSLFFKHNRDWKDSSIMLPIFVESEDCVRMLLLHGADPNSGSVLDCSLTPHIGVDCQAQSGRALNAAAERSTPAVFALLLEKGARLENALPLHSVMTSTRRPAGERIPMIEYLVEKLKCDVNALDHGLSSHRQLGTPLHYAIRYRRLEEALWLLSVGAEVNRQNQRGQTALDLAQLYGNKEGILLLERHQVAAMECSLKDTEDLHHCELSSSP